MVTTAATTGPLPQPETLPQALVELSRALYLLYTGKMVRMLEELINTSYDNLFNHFTNELLADPTWAECYNLFAFII